MVNPKLGSYIRQLRLASDTYRSVRKFAKALSKTPSWVSKVERNLEKPGPETLTKIAELLSVDIAELMQLAGRLEPDVEHELAQRYATNVVLLKTINKMTPRQIEELTRTASDMVAENKEKHGIGQ